MSMRLAEGIWIENEETFGKLKFSAMRRERFETDEEGRSTGVLRERVYDLKSRTQQSMIQVGIPADVEEKKFDYDAEVELVNPVVDTVANADGYRAQSNWYVKADDIILKNSRPGAARQPEKPENRPGAAPIPGAKPAEKPGQPGQEQK